MKCFERDQDILLMVHGELPVLRKYVVASHINRCPRCQEKRSEFSRVSKQIASAIRSSNRALPKWQLVKTAALASSRHMKYFVTLLALTLTVALVTGGVIQAVNTARSQTLYHPIYSTNHPVITHPCSPGIPCDKCR